MKNQIKRIRVETAIAAILTCSISSVFSDGYRNPPPTAAGIAKSGANMIFSDDASAIFYNPANLAGSTNSSFVFSVTMAQTENKYKGPGYSATSEGDWNLLPSIFFSTPVGDSGLVAGLGISTPFGQGSEYDKADLAPSFSPTVTAIHEAQVAMVNINPTIAFPVGETISMGVGADIYYSKLNFKQFYPWASIPGPPPFPLPNQDVEADGDGVGLGGNIGVTWDVSERQSLAFSYRSEFTIDYDGDLDASPNGIVTPPQLASSSFDMEITYPNILGAGYGIVLGESVRLEASLEWLEWSSNKSLDADLGANGKLSIPQDWDDTFTFSFGGDWQINESWIVRAGYAFIESPIPDATIAPILPDADRHALSLGFGYTTGKHTFDVSYTYSIYDDREPTIAENPAFPGSYDIDSNLVGLTYSLSF